MIQAASVCVYVCVIASDFFVFWLNGTRITSNNRHVYRDNQRVSVEGHGNTYNLVVRDVRQWDDGEYTCQVPGPHNLSQTSRVIISSKFEVEAENWSVSTTENVVVYMPLRRKQL